MIRQLSVFNQDHLIASTGEVSDFQAIVEYFQEKDLADSIQEDGVRFHTAKDYANYLCKSHF